MGKYPCMYVGDGCTSGKQQAFRESACRPCREVGLPPGPGNTKGRQAATEFNAEYKASGKRKEYNDKNGPINNAINGPINNAKKKAKKETAYRQEAQSQLGAALDPELTDEEAQEQVQTFVYTDSMVASFIKASATDNPISGYFGFTGCPSTDNEAIRFLWAHNSRPVVQPIDPNDPRASKTTGFLTEANARQLATWTKVPLYQTNNLLNIKKVEYWAQQALDNLPLGVKMWRVPGAGGGKDKRTDIGKMYKLFFTQLNDTPEALGLKVVE